MSEKNTNRKVIDLCMDIPPEAEDTISTLKSYFLDPAFSNFKTLYAPFTLKTLGATLEETDKVLAEEGEEAFVRFLEEKAAANMLTLDQFVADMDRIGIEWGMVNAANGDNAKTAEIVARYPDRMKGFIALQPSDAMSMVRQLEQCVSDYHLDALYVTPFRYKVPASHPTMYPVYAKCVELNLPIHFHCSMSSGTDVHYDVAHPRYIDQVAMDFPELRIMASVGGWPWVQEFMTLPIRHQNLYLNIETHQPRDLISRGSGLEAYLHYGEMVLSKQLCFASNWTALSLSLEEVVAQVDELPFSDQMKENFLYNNAKRFYEGGISRG